MLSVANSTFASEIEWSVVCKSTRVNGASGFQNLETTAKYRLYKNAEHEFIVSVGLVAEWANTGAQSLSVDTFTTYTPTLYFGKGFGDLPDTVWWARPLAVTGVFGYAIPSRSRTVTQSVDPDSGDVIVDSSPGPLAEELVRLNVDVIVVDGSATAKAVKNATSVTPVVFSLATDPVSEGLATNMAHPGGNLTGLTLSVGYQLAGKRAELLKGINPNLSRLAVLAQPDNTTARAYLDDIAAVSRSLGIEMRKFEARAPDELPPAFVAMKDWQANGLVTLNDALLFSQRERITAGRNSKVRSRTPSFFSNLNG